MAKGDKIPGGLSDNWSVEDIAKKHDVSVDDIKKELDKGVDIELEHTNSKDKAREIALDHLYEFPDYYTRLKDMENKAEKDLNEGKENITDYARRMRELAGLSDGDAKKSLKTIQEGFDEGAKFMAKDFMTSNDVVEDESVNESEAKLQGFDKVPGDLEGSAEDRDEEFETHKFEQKTIEEGADDDELYTLNENTIIVLDFLDEEDDK